MNFKLQPYAHQLKELERSKDKEYWAYLMEMGTGKTKLTIDGIQYLYDAGLINRVLILAPAGVYRNWTGVEIPKHMIESEFVGYTYRSAYMRAAERERLDDVVNNYDLSIVATNIETLSSAKGFEWCEWFVRGGRTMVIIDESSCIKNTSAARTKNAIKLGRLAKYRRVLTGTPVTQSPLDIFGQGEFLKPGVFGFSSFFKFKMFYAMYVTISYGSRSFPKLTGYRNLNELMNTVSKFASVLTKKDCLDLPEKVYVQREVLLTPEQIELYETLRTTHVHEIEDASISIANALKLMTKFHQIVCGHVKYDDGQVKRVPNNRITALIEAIEECAGKVIIFANFVEDILMIAEALKDEHGEHSYVTYAGETDTQTREANAARFRTDPNCRFFVASQRVAGFGLTLVEASTTIYYSNSFSLEHRLQSEDRNHRIGQKNNVTYIDLVADCKIDKRITDALRSKKEVADLFLGGIRGLV
jgi:SNF2 family DNA or RNA helicase